ncbi:hypothetical protein OA848_02210 [Rickettsiales bacterium]|nr:hypothetical protein [Rickettsiales bacterium]
MYLSLIVSTLLNWININTTYDTRKFNVKIIEVSKKEIQKLACKGKCPIISFYKRNEGIYITKMNFKNNLCNQSILLHEIIHALQESKKMENAFREKEAYEIQNHFLMQKSSENNSNLLSVRKCRSIQEY